MKVALLLIALAIATATASQSTSSSAFAEVLGVWKRENGGGCESWVNFFAANYLAYNIDCGDSTGAFAGVYAIDTDEGVITVSYVTTPFNDTGGPQIGDVWQFDYTVVGDVLTLYVPENWASSTSSTTALTYDRITDAVDIDGVWQGTNTQPETNGNVTTDVDIPLVAQVLGGHLYLSFSLPDGYESNIEQTNGSSYFGILDYPDVPGDCDIRYAATGGEARGYNLQPQINFTLSVGDPPVQYFQLSKDDTYSFLDVKVPDSILQGVWIGQIDTLDCLTTVEFNGDVYRTYHYNCDTDEDEALVGTFHIDNDQLTVRFLWAPNSPHMENFKSVSTFNIDSSGVLTVTDPTSSAYTGTFVKIDYAPESKAFVFTLVGDSDDFEVVSFMADLADQLGINVLLTQYLSHTESGGSSSTTSSTLPNNEFRVRTRLTEDPINGMTISDIQDAIGLITEIDGFPISGTAILSSSSQVDNMGSGVGANAPAVVCTLLALVCALLF